MSNLIANFRINHTELTLDQDPGTRLYVVSHFTSPL